MTDWNWYKQGWIAPPLTDCPLALTGKEITDKIENIIILFDQQEETRVAWSSHPLIKVENLFIFLNANSEFAHYYVQNCLEISKRKSVLKRNGMK